MWRSLVVGMVMVAANASDWHQWRGPGRDGSAPDFQVPTSWPENLKKIWSIQVGAGLASPVMAGDRVYVFTREGEQEVLSCYATRDGAQIWRQSYDAPFTPNTQAMNERQFPASKGSGPFATPSLAAGRILTLGVSKILSCFDARTGAPLWRNTYYPVLPPAEKQWACPPCNGECCKKAFTAAGKCPDCNMPLTLVGQETTTVAVGNYYGAAGSPLVIGELGVVQVRHGEQGELIGFNLKDGTRRWSVEEPIPASVSPILARFGGVDQIVDISRASIEGVSLEGKLLWHHDIVSNAQIVTPIAFEDLLIYAPYRGALQALRITPDGSSFKVASAWEASDHPLLISSPILLDGTLIGMDTKKRGRLFQVDARTGKTLWTDEGNRGESASLLQAHGTVMVLTSAGELLFFQRNDQGWVTSASYGVASSPTWTHPVLWGDKVLVKDAVGLQLYSL